MTYLIAKFALIFLAATILGLILGYWWAKSRFVDVTESFQRLTSRSEEDRAAFNRIGQKVDALNLSPLEQRVDNVETLIRDLPQPEMPAPVDLKPVHERIHQVEQLIRAIPQPEKVDLQPMGQRLQVLENQLKAFPRPEKVDLMPVNQKLQALEARLGSLPQPEKVELAPLYQKIQAIEEKLGTLPQPEKVDLAPIYEKLHHLNLQMKLLPAQVKQEPLNIAPLHEGINHIGQAVTSIRSADGVNLEPIEVRLKAIEEKLQGLLTNKSANGSANTAAAGSGPRLLRSASHGKKDDLKEISGVGPKLERLLNQIGVYYFWQVASWNPADVQAVDDMLEVFKGRIERDNWVSQAKKLKHSPGAAREMV